jgi:hypothetical protein
MTFTGALSPQGVEREMARAWALVAPSRWAEPLGLVAIGDRPRTPVVAARTADRRERRGRRQRALVPNGDVDALARRSSRWRRAGHSRRTRFPKSRVARCSSGTICSGTSTNCFGTQVRQVRKVRKVREEVDVDGRIPPHADSADDDGVAHLFECVHDVRVVRASEESQRAALVHRRRRQLGDLVLRIRAAGACQPDWLHAPFAGTAQGPAGGHHLLVFVPFAVAYMRQPIKLDYVWAGLCLLGAVYFVFRS